MFLLGLASSPSQHSHLSTYYLDVLMACMLASGNIFKYAQIRMTVREGIDKSNGRVSTLTAGLYRFTPDVLKF